MTKKMLKNNRHRNTVIKGSLLLLSCLILSGCIGAGIMAVQSGYDTYKGSDATQVIVVKKKKNITAIDKVTLYVAGMGSSGTIELQKKGTLRPLIISALKSKNLYQSGDLRGDSLIIQIREVVDGYTDRTISTYVIIKDYEGKVIASKAYFVDAAGFRSLEYAKEAFAQSVATYIKQPMVHVKHQHST